MREKLIELLEELCVDYGATAIFFTSGEAEVLADHLIANGVTIEDDRPRFFIGRNQMGQEELAQIIGSGPVILSVGEEAIIPIHPGRWVPVTERLPEDASTVLASDSDGTISSAYYVGRWHSGGDLDEDAVTHWMPLPEPPKEVE